MSALLHTDGRFAKGVGHSLLPPAVLQAASGYHLQMYPKTITDSTFFMSVNERKPRGKQIEHEVDTRRRRGGPTPQCRSLHGFVCLF